MLIAFTSVNRLTALLFPSKHEKLWSKGVWYCMGFSFVLAFILSWYFLFSTISVIEFTPGIIGYYVFIYGKAPIKISSAHVELSVLAISGAVTVVSNLISLIVLIRQNLKRFTQSKNKSEMKRYFRKAELGLFAVAVGDFVVMCLGCIIIVNLIILMIDNDYNNPWFDFYYLQLAWVSDISFLSRPVLLMLMSKNVRKVVVNSLLCSEAEEFQVKTITASRSHISRISVRSKQTQVY
uniref:Serpentine receptor class gamma n=1 Tax=Panagrolaimus sp. PS1159 TaxID=55785 RepID=A0AC35ET96_9BILA